eukprot:1702611-Prymnesium_polylepis.2
MTAHMLSLGAHVISVEPQPDLAAAVRETALLNCWTERSLVLNSFACEHANSNCMRCVRQALRAARAARAASACACLFVVRLWCAYVSLAHGASLCLHVSLTCMPFELWAPPVCMPHTPLCTAHRPRAAESVMAWRWGGVPQRSRSALQALSERRTAP